MNPWNPRRWTGVSSSGSGVATAAGFCYGAIGSDTGGSIRMPSSANNLTGIKPTWGRVSRHGLVHLCESFDHLGPMARSAEDAAAILQAIAGDEPLDPTSLPDPVPDYLPQGHVDLSSLVIGVDWDFTTQGIDQPIVAALRDALAVLVDLGARVREIAFPWTEDDFSTVMGMFEAEIALAHADHFPAKRERYGNWLGKMLTHAADNRDRTALARAYLARERYRGRLRRIFTDVDLIILPGLGRTLPTWEEIDARTNTAQPFDPHLIRFTLPLNVAGSRPSACRPALRRTDRRSGCSSYPHGSRKPH